MYKNKKVLAIVPARGGSKGVPLKNIRMLKGMPLIAWVGKAAKPSKTIDEIVVSTDHNKIAEIAKEHGIKVPFIRPEEISGDRIGDVDVLTHALLATEKKYDTTYDIVVMLQPTSPSRKTIDIDACVKMLIDDELDSVWTVSQTDSKAHPLKQLTLNNGKLGYYDEAGKTIIARQQLSPVYHRNGIAYALTKECLLKQKTLMGEKSSAIAIEGIAINIDTEWDFKFAEYVFSLEENEAYSQKAIA